MKSVGAKIGHAFVYKLMFPTQLWIVSCPNPDLDLLYLEQPHWAQHWSASWERESEILGPLCLVSGNKDAIRQMALCGQTRDNDRQGDYQAQTGKAPVQCS